jgi:WD40 repeat protein
MHAYSARIVDLVSGREAARLAGYHKDVVSTVAFNPLFPQLATASFDGSVQFYADPHLFSHAGGGMNV